MSLQSIWHTIKRLFIQIGYSELQKIKRREKTVTRLADLIGNQHPKFKQLVMTSNNEFTVLMFFEDGQLFLLLELDNTGMILTPVQNSLHPRYSELTSLFEMFRQVFSKVNQTKLTELAFDSIFGIVYTGEGAVNFIRDNEGEDEAIVFEPDFSVGSKRKKDKDTIH